MSGTPGPTPSKTQTPQTEDLQRLWKAFYNESRNPAGLDVLAGTTKQWETNNTFYYRNDGKEYARTALTAQTFATASGVTAKSLGLLQKCLFLFVIKAGTAKVVQSDVVASSAADPDLPQVPAGYAPFGYCKIVTAAAAVFVPDTTNMDAADVTTTFVDLGWPTSGKDGAIYTAIAD